MNRTTQKIYSDLRNSLDSRRYRIGLDLGVGSIGFAIAALKDDQPTDIILAGSRIFEPSKGGKERRVNRGARNCHNHKRKRLLKLWKYLADYGMAQAVPQDLRKGQKERPGSRMFNRFSDAVLKLDPYTLRYKGLHEKIEPEELGCCIYHLATHRGTSSVRTFLDDDEETKKETLQTRKKAQHTEEEMHKNEYLTYGELLYKTRIEPFVGQNREKPLRNRKGKDFEFIATRDVVIQELDSILTRQKEIHNNELITDKFIKDVKAIVDFEGDKYVPPPGKCPYTGEVVLPRSHPLNEERRLWEALNNSKIEYPHHDSEGKILHYESETFSREEKEKLFKILYSGTDLTASNVIKTLGIDLPTNKVQIILQGRSKDRQRIVGFRFKELVEMSWWKEFSGESRISFLRDWNQTPDDRLLLKKLVKEYGLDSDEANGAIRSLNLPSGYAPLGKTALEYVMTHIKEGRSFTEAIDAGYQDGTFHKEERKIFEKLPYYGCILTDSVQPVVGKSFQNDSRYRIQPHTNRDELNYGRIPNPVVHQTLNELQKVVNEIIDVFGEKPDSIMFETARDLNKSQDDRDRIIREQNANEKKRNEIYKKYCEPHNLKDSYIYKFMLFEEQEEKCPYCANTITPDAIIQGLADIDHILPRELTDDNSRNNHVLSHKSCNAAKGRKSPYEAFSGSTDRWITILSHLENLTALKRKKWRFEPDAMKVFSENAGMKDRYKTDNSYISRVARKYLGCIMKNQYDVIGLKGFLTAQLRLAWNLKGIMIPRARQLLLKKDMSEFENDVNKDKKIRLDHRHHALDAIVLTFAGRNYQKMLSTLSGKGYTIDYRKRNWLSDMFPPPMDKTLDEFTRMVARAVDSAFISLKQDHNPNGELTKKTAYQILLQDGQDLILSTRKNVNEISHKKKLPLEHAETILDKPGRFEQYKEFNSSIAKIFHDNSNIYSKLVGIKDKAREKLELDNRKALDIGKKEKPVTEAQVDKMALEMIGGIYRTLESKQVDKFFTVMSPEDKQRGFGYDKGENLCLDLYLDRKGRLKGEVIRKVDFVQNNIPLYKRDGMEFLERIYQGDVLEIDVTEKPTRSVRPANAPAKRTFVRVITFTETINYYKNPNNHNKRDSIQIFFQNLLKSQKRQDDSFSISTIQNANARKVVLSPLGIPLYRSPVLKGRE